MDGYEHLIRTKSWPAIQAAYDDGAYVAAWLWVNKEDAGICRECGEVNADNGEGWDGLCGNCADKASAKDVRSDQSYPA